MQPFIVDANGVVRFKENAIVRWLLDRASAGLKTDLNAIAMQGFSENDQAQFAQLIGYSLSGYHELSYVSGEAALAASHAAREQLGRPDIGGCRDQGCEIHCDRKEKAK